MKKIIFALIALPLFVSCKQEFHIYTLQAGDIWTRMATPPTNCCRECKKVPL